ncbi:unnamed protein product [Dibothriocephalus latus]|uniref:Uncharacterized protein n=1 Tax=Dibothriocephalus latus TaxID=60516 RepID=A0A3P7LMS8_DIBLA|nr:unnamed protein product [Dibothriocephalus latus]
MYELGPSAETFHSARDYPPNADFHVNETLGPKPPPAGVFDISNCIFKKKRRVPLFLSLPYFNKAAVEVRDKINFIGEPKQDLEFTLNVEPFPVLKYNNMHEFYKEADTFAPTKYLIALSVE